MEQIKKPEITVEDRMSNKQFAEWLSSNFDDIPSGIAGDMAFRFSDIKREIWVKVKKEMPGITRGALEKLGDTEQDRDKVLKNIKTFKDNRLDPHAFVQILTGSSDYIERNVESLIARKLDVYKFMASLRHNPEFVEANLRILEERKINPADFKAKSVIGESQERFKKLIDSTKKERVMVYSFADKKYCKLLILGDREAESRLSSEEEREVFSKVWKTLSGRGEKGEISKSEIWDILKGVYKKDFPGNDMSDFTYDTRVHSLYNRMNGILQYLVKNGGLDQPVESVVKKKRYLE